MKLALAILLTVASVATAKPAPKATPAPAKPAAQPEAVIETSTGSVTLTQAQRDEIDGWLDGLQKANAGNKAIAEQQKTRADQAEAEAKASRDQDSIVIDKLSASQQQLGTLQSAIDAQTKQLQTTIDALNKSLKDTAKYKAESDKRGNLIGWTCGIALALLVAFLLSKFGALIPLPYKLAVEIAAPLVAASVGYFVSRLLI